MTPSRHAALDLYVTSLVRTRELKRQVMTEEQRGLTLRTAALETGVSDSELRDAEWDVAMNTASTAAEKSYTLDEVMAALNRASDYVRDQQEYECEETIRQQSYGDLIVNLAGGWLDDMDAEPEQIIEANWSEPAAKVLSWAGLAEYDESEDDESEDDE